MRHPADLEIPPPGYRVTRVGRRMDPATRRLGLIACGLGAVLLAVGAVWAVSGRQGSTAVPVIEADSQPVRVKPANPGGMQVAGVGDSILSGQDHGGIETLAPPPEVPAPQALRAASSPPPPQAPAAIIPPAPAPAPPATAASAPARPTPSMPSATAAIAQRPAAAPPGHTEVQLAAFDSEAAARAEWDRLGKRMPDLLGGHRADVLRADVAGRTVWRLRTGGFADTAQATAFCERVRAKGAGCAIASF